MKNTFLLAVCFILIVPVFAQHGVTYYYGKEWDNITEDNSSVFKVSKQSFVDKALGLGYEFHTDASFYETGNLVDGKKDSIWTGYYPDGSLYYRETYKKGKLIHGTSISTDGKKYNYEEEYVGPRFKGGGMNQFRIYHQDYWRTILAVLKKKYPEHYAKLLNTPYEVSTEFSVDADGTAQVVNVSGGKDFGYDIKLAQHLLDKYNDWKPACFKGKPQRVMMHFGIAVICE